MPVFTLGKKKVPAGDGWNSTRIANARALVLSEGLSTDPTTMTHPEFCSWWAEYRLSQTRNR